MHFYKLDSPWLAKYDVEISSISFPARAAPGQLFGVPGPLCPLCGVGNRSGKGQWGVGVGSGCHSHTAAVGGWGCAALLVTAGGLCLPTTPASTCRHSQLGESEVIPGGNTIPPGVGVLALIWAVQTITGGFSWGFFPFWAPPGSVGQQQCSGTVTAIPTHGERLHPPGVPEARRP